MSLAMSSVITFTPISAIISETLCWMSGSVWYGLPASSTVRRPSCLELSSMRLFAAATAFSYSSCAFSAFTKASMAFLASIP